MLALWRSLPTWAKWLIGSIGTVIGGALSNGVWEIALRPGLGWLYEAILNSGTLGLQALQDQIYRDVARGNIERAGLQSFLMIMALFVALPAGFAFSVVSRKLPLEMFGRRLFRTKRSSLMARLASLPADQRAAEAKAEFERQTKRAKRFLTIFFLALTVSLASSVFTAVRLNYVATASAYLTQLQAIAAPFVSPEERLAYASKAAQIGSRADFLALTSEFEAIAKSHAAKVPKFETF